MFLLDAPYVSDFLIQTVETLNLPVLDTPNARRLTAGANIPFVDQIEFTSRLAVGQRVLANSENGLEHLAQCGCHDDLTRQIEVCKDKIAFRTTIADLHPDYQFMRATPDELDSFDISGMACPFIIKPARGFFSLGVHVVNDHGEWPDVVKAIKAEQAAMNADYPAGVVDPDVLIIEDGIPGEEYAIDLYYNGDGEPVITNIMHHHFMAEDDVSDRLYYTSAAIITDWLEPFTAYAEQMGRACEFRNFPMHLEVRATDDGTIVPIEANPLRFAGWCVADITNHAWGFNPYACYFTDTRPDWPTILQGKEDAACAMVVGDVPPEIDRATIVKIDYDQFCTLFDTVLELREIDYNAYPVFAFVFANTDLRGIEALKTTLATDFNRFIITNDA
ncbi:MAG: ATP-grasp domain-containing protein [Pseudodesulfovibrio sp.]